MLSICLPPSGACQSVLNRTCCKEKESERYYWQNAVSISVYRECYWKVFASFSLYCDLVVVCFHCLFAWLAELVQRTTWGAKMAERREITKARRDLEDDLMLKWPIKNCCFSLARKGDELLDLVFIKKIIKFNFFKNNWNRTEIGSNRSVLVRFCLFRKNTGSNWFGSIFLIWFSFFQFFLFEYNLIWFF